MSVLGGDIRDYIEVGATPCDEDCEQLGPGYDPAKARAECKAFIGQIRRELGLEPDGARLTVRSNPHDFGTYIEVACVFDDENEAASDYAFKCESTSPNWDETARRELGLVAS